MKNLFLLSLSIIHFAFSAYPIAIFHGLGASCDMKRVSRYIDKLSFDLNSNEVTCIEIGNGIIDSVLMSIEEQSKEACEKVKKIPMFSSDFSIIGLSQGSLIGRYIIEKCNMKGTVRRFISISGPQMGISNLFPHQYCSIFCGLFNYAIEKIISFNLFKKNMIAPIGYYRPKGNNKSYDNSTNNFIAELNNEVILKQASIKDRMLKLEMLVLIMNDDDRIVHPPSSAWFEFYDRWGNFIVPLRKSRFYIEDYIGIRQLDENNKMKLIRLPGRHLYVTNKHISKYIIPYLI